MTVLSSGQLKRCDKREMANLNRTKVNKCLYGYLQRANFFFRGVNAADGPRADECHVEIVLLFAISSMCIVVTVEVLTNSVHEWNISVAEQSKNVDWDYSVGQKNGRSAYMAWTCVCVYALAAISFALGSHKQKGSRAATAEFEIEDRPIHIGR
uniref:Uncharacterized protein n=1 Tax=Parascaris equorum TaxID=6256 RepID=A0A914RYZ5_PAREQ